MPKLRIAEVLPTSRSHRIDTAVLCKVASVPLRPGAAVLDVLGPVADAVSPVPDRPVRRGPVASAGSMFVVRYTVTGVRA